MATYMINYDLVSPGQDYDKLIDAIKSYGCYCKPLKSCWLIVSEKTPVAIRNHLKQYMDSNDKILVVKATAPAAWDKLGELNDKWLLNNLK